jgi:hypothetical protein
LGGEPPYKPFGKMLSGAASKVTGGLNKLVTATRVKLKTRRKTARLVQGGSTASTLTSCARRSISITSSRVIYTIWMKMALCLDSYVALRESSAKPQMRVKRGEVLSVDFNIDIGLLVTGRTQRRCYTNASKAPSRYRRSYTAKFMSESRKKPTR